MHMGTMQDIQIHSLPCKWRGCIQHLCSLSTQQFAMHSSIMNMDIINSRKCNNQSLSFKCVYVYKYLCLLCKNNTNIKKIN